MFAFGDRRVYIDINTQLESLQHNSISTIMTIHYIMTAVFFVAFLHAYRYVQITAKMKKRMPETYR